jgi:hypothetical protein
MALLSPVCVGFVLWVVTCGRGLGPHPPLHGTRSLCAPFLWNNAVMSGEAWAPAHTGQGWTGLSAVGVTQPVVTMTLVGEGTPLLRMAPWGPPFASCQENACRERLGKFRDTHWVILNQRARKSLLQQTATDQNAFLSSLKVLHITSRRQSALHLPRKGFVT